jgi:hypothetical protein
LIPFFIGLGIYLACPVVHDDEKRFFLCSVAAFWVGMSVASQEFRKERYLIFIHEKMAQIPSYAFFLSNALFYGIISLIQTLVLIGFSLHLLNQGVLDSYTMEYSFVLDPKYETELNQGIVSPSLRQALEEEGMEIPESVRVVAKEKHQWSIVDLEKKLIAFLAKEKQIQVYNQEITKKRIWVFFYLVWFMGIVGTILGLNFSLFESSCRLQFPTSVTVPCLTVLQLLFSEMVMLWLSKNQHQYFLLFPEKTEYRDFFYLLIFSRYPDMAFRSYKNAHWQITENFYNNLEVFLCFAFLFPLLILAFQIKIAKRPLSS